MFVLDATFSIRDEIMQNSRHHAALTKRQVTIQRQIEGTTDENARVRLRGEFATVQDRVKSADVIFQVLADYTRSFWTFFSELRRTYQNIG